MAKGLYSRMPPGDQGALGAPLPDSSAKSLQGYGSSRRDKERGYTRLEGPPLFDLGHRDYPADEGFLMRPGVPVTRSE